MPFILSFRTLFRSALAILALVAALALYLEWRQARRDQRELRAQLDAAEKILSDAQARQKARDAEVHDTLAELAKRKRQTKSPEEIVRALTRELALPRPITLAGAGNLEQQAANAAPSETLQTGAATSLPARQMPSTHSPDTGHASRDTEHDPPAQIPVEDLKPIFDFVMDCKACQAQLSAAEGNLADERAKNSALVTERDAALKAAKGGGFWRRARRAAKWFAIGAATGAVAAAAASH